MRTKPAISLTAPVSARARIGLGRADLLSLTLLAVAAFFMLTHLERWPLWYDEGWTFEVAQTWVDQGHYGVIAADGPRGKSLAAAFPTVATTALSFKLLGVGVWQGRLPATLLMLGSLALLAVLARRLYNPRVAAATLAVLLLGTHVALSPLGLGVQTLAEPAMIFCLTAAYLALPAALARPWPWLGLFWLCAGVGLATKGQPLPFVTASLLAPAALALWYGQRRTAALLALTLAGALAVLWAAPALQAALLAGHSVSGEAIPELTRTISLAFDSGLRLMSLSGAYGAGPALVGLAYALWRLRGNLPAAVDAPRAVTRTALLGLAVSWGAWHFLLSIGWPRYLFPTAFFGAIFAAQMLDTLTGGFNLRATAARLAPGVATRRHLLGAGALMLIYLFGLVMLVNGMVERFGDPKPAQAPGRTVAWLNANTPPDALIETYDPELLFKLERRFHYPPDRYHAEILRMRHQLAGATTGYDPLSAAPDYIAEGPFGGGAELYRRAIAAGGYRLVFTEGPYRIYARP